MKLSYNWLNDFLDLQENSPQELAQLLTMKTCEVEEVYPFYEFLKKIPVVLVKEVKPHPDADKLVVCSVDNGQEILQIVTGAPNVKAGKKYAHAAVGSILPSGMVMKKAKLRGLDSFGMLASSKELDLEELMIGEEGDEHGLLTLPDSFVVGTSLREALHFDDIILEIDNKSITHRPDLWSHFGFARELSVLLQKPIKFFPLQQTFTENPQLNETLKNPTIKIDGKSALGYCGVVIDNVKVKPSDLAIQARLLAVGARPINNMVDVSNYVMFDIGQPNHAFDYGSVQEITVSPSQEGETITTLDEKTHDLGKDIILIRNQKTPVAIGGVMGGLASSVQNSTKTLFVESACFYRSDIRRAVSRLGIRSDSSQRYEKGQDPSLIQPALHRFASLLQTSCPNLTMGKISCVQKEEAPRSVINTTLNYIKSRLGKIDLSREEIIKIFQRMDMKVSVLEDEIQVEVPSYRSGYDIKIPEDLVEEVGRMVGYLSIETEPFLVACQVPQFINRRRNLEHELRDLFSKSFSFSEVYNYAFCAQEDIDTDMRYAQTAVRLQNPIHQELEFLRVSPLPSLLKNIAQNYRRYKDLRFFEVEKIFLPARGKSAAEENLPHEEGYLAGVMTSAQDDEKVLNYLSSVLSYVLEKCGLPYNEQKCEVLADENIFHPGRAGKIVSRDNEDNEKILFRWGQVHPLLTEKYNIDKTTVFYFEAFLQDLQHLKPQKSFYRPLVKYPSVNFELTLLMNKRQYFLELLQAIGEAQKEAPGSEKTFVEKIEHLTTYQGENLPADTKAVSIRVVWRNYSRTLEPDEIKNLQEKLISRLNDAGFKLKS